MPRPTTSSSKTPTTPSRPLPKRLARIQAGTAKQMAKNLLTDKYGHAVSDTKLKEFMKQDKDLKKFVYTSKTSTLTKHEAQKFFNKVVDSARASEGFKVSRTAKKMGIKDTAPKTSDVQLEKIYKSASQAEIDAMPHDTGPTPEELAKQARREKMLKTLHKRERAEEISREERAEKEQKGDGEQKPATNAKPPQMVGTSGIGTIGGGGGTGQPNTPAPASQQRQTDKTPDLRLMIFPLENQSPNIPGFELTVQKLNTFIRQHLQSGAIIPICTEQEMWDAMNALRIETVPSATQLDELRSIARRANVGLFLVSTISRQGQTTELTLMVHNTMNAHVFQLAHLKEPLTDVFDFQRRLGWQIDAGFRAQSEDEDTTTPSSSDAVELPI